jgi:hypothetical protein
MNSYFTRGAYGFSSAINLTTILLVEILFVLVEQLLRVVNLIIIMEISSC